ncbi:MAG: hypothetical protein EXQ95_00330 [Alphaproteobacteria bacterium]|nr:hypothetical protein [Alphaproteobacteria bacterium]
MSEYVDRKAREALAQADGDHGRAAELLEIWCGDDVRLKGALIRPFLPNICRFAIQRTTARPSTRDRAKVKGTAIDLVIDALQEKTGKRRLDPAIPQPAPKPAEASPKHAKALQALASSYKKKKS